MPSQFTTEVLSIKCRACDALPGSKCIVGATGATATKPHNVRVADAAESLFTPDPQTADEFSEYDTEATEPEMSLDELADVIESVQAEAEAEPVWTEIKAKDVQPGMVIEHKGEPATIAGRRVTDKWVTALDEDLSTLLYVKPDSVIRAWL